jgi:hypothetical protein
VKARTWARFHVVMTFVWMLLAYPTLVWWHSSILWVASMSLYANAVGHFSAYQAARAECANTEEES